MGATRGSGYVSQVTTTSSLVFPGSCWPSFERITFDNWGLLSHCLFDERLVESELSSWGAWYVGLGRS